MRLVESHNSRRSIDLSGWTVHTWDYSGNPNGSWIVDSSKTLVTQTLNTDPSAFLNGVNITSYTMRGNFRVNTTTDDDMVGFVFGYQDSNHFHLFDWKQANQSPGLEGFSVRKYSAPTGYSWQNADFGATSTTYMQVLASDHGSDKGWVDLTTYGFFLDFQPETFQIRISQNSLILYDVIINDSSFTSGQFGLFNDSQPNAQYFDLIQTNVPIPEPVSMLLFGTGLIGVGGYVKRKLKG